VGLRAGEGYLPDPKVTGDCRFYTTRDLRKLISPGMRPLMEENALGERPMAPAPCMSAKSGCKNPNKESVAKIRTLIRHQYVVATPTLWAAHRADYVVTSSLRPVEREEWSMTPCYARLKDRKGDYLVGNTVQGLRFVNDGHLLSRMLQQLMAVMVFHRYLMPSWGKDVIRQAVLCLAPGKSDPSREIFFLKTVNQFQVFFRRLQTITDGVGIWQRVKTGHDPVLKSLGIDPLGLYRLGNPRVCLRRRARVKSRGVAERLSLLKLLRDLGS